MIDSAPQHPINTKPEKLSSRRVWKMRLAALMLSCFVGLITLKGADLIIGWTRETQSRHWMRLTPNTSIRHRSTEFDYFFTTNRLGFRGEDMPFEKPLGTRRIVVLGDSFTAGSGVAEKDLFTVKVEELLNEDDPPSRHEVINLGRVGSSTIRERDMYELYGERFEPDVVVLAVFLGNDLAEIVEEHDRQELLNWRPEGHVRRWTYWYLPNLYLELAMIKQARREQSQYRERSEREQIAEMRQAAVNRGRKPEWGEERFLRLPEEVRTAARQGLFPSMHLIHSCLDPQRRMRALSPDDEFFHQAWPRVEDNLDALQSRISRDGAKLLLVIFPSSVQTTSAAAEFQRSIGFEVDRSWLTGPCRTQTAFHQWATRTSVPLLDLTEDIRTHDVPVFHRWDTHFNPAGHALVARKLAAWAPLLETTASAAKSFP